MDEACLGQRGQRSVESDRVDRSKGPRDGQDGVCHGCAELVEGLEHGDSGPGPAQACATEQLGAGEIHATAFMQTSCI